MSKGLKVMKDFNRLLTTYIPDYIIHDNNGWVSNIVKSVEQTFIKAQEQEKILKIIFEKRVDMWHLADLLDQTYEMYLAFCSSEKYASDYILTNEEFNLLKEYFKHE